MDLVEEIVELVVDIFAWIVTVVYYLLLFFSEIVSWFDDYQATQSDIDANEVGFTILQAVNDPSTKVIPGVFSKTNSNYVTVQGVFNKDSQKVTAARKIESESIDSQLANNHQRNPVVLYS